VLFCSWLFEVTCLSFKLLLYRFVMRNTSRLKCLVHDDPWKIALRHELV